MYFAESERESRAYHIDQSTYLTTIPVAVGVSGESGLLKLKTCSLYY